MKCFQHVRKLEWGKHLNVKTNTSVIPWSPIARGALAKPRSATSLRSETDPFLHMLVTNQQRDSEKEIIDRVEALAQKKGVSMAIIATAWLLSKEGISPRRLL